MIPLAVFVASFLLLRPMLPLRCPRFCRGVGVAGLGLCSYLPRLMHIPGLILRLEFRRLLWCLPRSMRSIWGFRLWIVMVQLIVSVPAFCLRLLVVVAAVPRSVGRRRCLFVRRGVAVVHWMLRRR